ncbi:hypothetical protein BKA66DRAFT_565632 [Pyrenochaeta sp. MPI-SDFR-AT-0127]|nr:hypothetical protein BKA66DRAFT_565632 [Pyrenochaeta sp. MPI-SDFR-AT-0127]
MDRDSRQCRKRVYRLKNGLISLNKTPPHLASTVLNNSLSPLLNLPAEIRTKIFEHVVGGNVFLIGAFRAVFFRHKDSTNPDYYTFHPERQLTLLRVCRQIYSETATLIFRTSLFRFASCRGLEKVWERLLPAQRDSVRRMVMDIHLLLPYLGPQADPNRVWSDPCPMFRNLHTIVIINSPYSPQGKELEHFMKMIEEVQFKHGLRVVIQDESGEA